MKLEHILSYLKAPYTPGGRSVEEGFDCWTLLVDVYAKHKSVTLPEFPHVSRDDLREIKNNITKGSAVGGWTEIDEPVHLCAVGMSKFNRCLHHVGIYLDIDGGKVLHAFKGSNVVCEPINKINQDFKIVRYYGLRN